MADTGEGYTTNIKDPSRLPEKRVSCETLWDQKPVNTTEFSTDNIIKFQIPTTDALFDFSRAFITLDYLMPVNITGFINQNRSTGDETAAKYTLTYIPLGAATGTINYNQTLTFQANPSAGVKDDEIFHDAMAILNAGSIFSLSEMYMDGNLIWHNDYCQAQSRLWQLNKNDQWLDSQPQSYFRPSKEQSINYAAQGFNQLVFGDIQFNKNDKVNMTLPDTNISQQFYIRRQLKIPLVELFPQFEVCNGWPSFLINQILYLQLTVSQANRYLVSILGEKYNSPQDGPFNVNLLNYRTGNAYSTASNSIVFNVPVDGKITSTTYPLGYDNDNDKINFYFTGFNITGLGGIELPKEGTNTQIGTVLSFDIKNLVLQNVRLYTPVHIPEFKEREEFQYLVGGALTYGFKYHSVLNSNVDLTYGTDNNTRAMSFNSAVNNIEAVTVLTMRDGTEVVYDKPNISAIQCNLGNNWLLAASGTHVAPLYNLDSDILTDLIKGWGQTDKKHMGTISEDVFNSYMFNIDFVRSNNNPYDTNGILRTYAAGEDGKKKLTTVLSNNVLVNTGAYIQYYDTSPGDELGVAAGQYARLINMRWNNNQLTGLDFSRANFQDMKMYICQQTYSTLVITPTSVYIDNPFADDFEPEKIIQTYRNVNFSENGLRTHGIGSMVMGGLKAAPGLVGAFTDLSNKIVDLKEKRKGIRNDDFHRQALAELGPVGYRKYHNEIDYYGTQSKHTSKKALKKMEKEWNAHNGNPFYKKSHGKYIPGTFMKRYKLMSFKTPRIGWRGKLNHRPVRLMPFGRGGVDARCGDIDAKHGLCQPYHGLADTISGGVTKALKHIVPGSLQEKVDPLLKYADPYIKKGGEYVERKLGEKVPGLIDKGKKVYKIAKKIQKKTGFFTKVKNWFKSKFHRRKHGRYRASLLAHGLPVSYLMKAPHMKRTINNFGPYYLKKTHGQIARFERKMIKMGNKRMLDARS